MNGLWFDIRLASKKLLMSFFKSILFRNLLTSTIFAMTWLALMLVRLPLSTALRITSAPSIKPLTLLLVTTLGEWCCEVVCKASKRMALSWSLKQLATSSETPGSCNKTHNCTHYIKQKRTKNVFTSRFITNSFACGLSSCCSEVELLARFLAANDTAEADGGSIQDCVLLRLKRGDFLSASFSFGTFKTKDLWRWNLSLLLFPIVWCCCSFLWALLSPKVALL